MVVRGGGAGAEFTVLAGAGCDGIAVIGPEGDCAHATSALGSPITAIHVSTVSFKK